MNHENKLVSIIMPAYNAEEFISDSIESVLQQTYNNWELIIVDDNSDDNTPEIVEKYSQKDSRIHLKVLDKNSGAAVSRNHAISRASGTYLAFLDSDDLWAKEKLTEQIKFMENNNYLFTSTSFEEINKKNQLNGNVASSHECLDYDGVLKYCPGNSTVIYNVSELGKFYVPDIKKRNDFVMWLQVIKKAKYLYGVKDILTKYRVSEGSLSSNKFSLVKYQWRVYRDIEDLSFIKSIYLLLHKASLVIMKQFNN